MVRFPWHVGRAVRNAPIREYQARRLAHLRQSRDIILEVHLELDDPGLKLNDVLGVVSREVAHPAAEGDYRWHFRHDQDLEPALGEVLLDGLEGSALSGTRAARQRDAVYRVFLVSLELVADAVEAERGEGLSEDFGGWVDLRIDGVGQLT